LVDRNVHVFSKRRSHYGVARTQWGSSSARRDSRTMGVFQRTPR
jgi:hypothetical protein